MFSEVFPYLIQQFSRIVNFVFSLTINENPHITFGEFLLACAFIGIVLYFLFGSDFLPNITSSSRVSTKKDVSNDGSSDYVPKHAYSPKHGKE